MYSIKENISKDVGKMPRLALKQWSHLLHDSYHYSIDDDDGWSLVLPFGMQDFSSPTRTRDWTHAPCSGCMESLPLDHQGSPIESSYYSIESYSTASKLVMAATCFLPAMLAFPFLSEFWLCLRCQLEVTNDHQQKSDEDQQGSMAFLL